MLRKLITLASGLLISTVLFAGKADVVDAKIRKTTHGTFNVTVTVKHADTGWKHYANKWDVLGPDGTVLATRTLYHPHVGEQPFTRNLNDVKIPASITKVTIRAHDLVDGYGGKTVTLLVPHL